MRRQASAAQQAYRLLVATSPAALQKDQGDLWDSGRVASSQNTWVEYAGKALVSGQRAYWKVRIWSDAGTARPWSDQASWSMGLLQASDWHAKWIGQRAPAGAADGAALPFPQLRKTFDLQQKPARAVAYVNALGYYELYINGKKVDDHVLSPHVSDYSKRTFYVAHEIADYLVPGKNVAALWLGRGWYVRGHPGVIHDGPLVRAQIEMLTRDGSRSEIVTDEGWKLRESPLSPVGSGRVFGDYGGEKYDASLELPGWNTVGLDDSSWQSPAVFEPPQVPATALMVEPNRIMETIKAVGVQRFAGRRLDHRHGEELHRMAGDQAAGDSEGDHGQARVLRPVGARQAGPGHDSGLAPRRISPRWRRRRTGRAAAERGRRAAASPARSTGARTQPGRARARWSAERREPRPRQEPRDQAPPEGAAETRRRCPTRSTSGMKSSATARR